MVLSPNDQITESIQRSHSPLLALPQNPSIDGISSALAISKMLKSMGKEPEIVSDNFKQPNYSFLERADKIAPMLSRLKPFVISLNVEKTKIDELTYDLRNGKLNLYLTPKEGSWRKEDLALSPTNYRHDLIITLECPDLAALGQTYKNEPEFFSSVPVLNIDHDPGNEHYGHINAVDMTATSVAEIIYPLLNAQSAIDEEVATLLLSGIIWKTRSFKSENVSPRTLRYASELVSAGARREVIVQELYRTRTIPTLRLWGRALARLKSDANLKIVWTLLTAQDFINAGVGEEALPEVVRELIAYSGDIDVAIILYEQRNGNICARLSSLQKKNALNLAEPWQGIGNSQDVSFCIQNSNLISAEKQILEHLKKKLTEQPK